VPEGRVKWFKEKKGWSTPVRCLLPLVILLVAKGSRNWPTVVCVGREHVQIVKGRRDHVDDQAL
jgi:hypothetical protein